jgi:hypothetical protein
MVETRMEAGRIPALSHCLRKIGEFSRFRVTDSDDLVFRHPCPWSEVIELVCQVVKAGCVGHAVCVDCAL